MNYKLIVEKQLAVDYNCTLEEVQSNQHIFTPIKSNEAKRLVGDDDCMLKIACINDKLLVTADEQILDWCRESFQNANAAWFSEPQKLCRLNDKLKTYGHYLADLHHYYIPSNIEPVQKRFDVEWYEEKEIKQFEEDERFDEALLFDEDTPDMIAVSAVKDGQILGMAGATADCENLWQIGVNVTEEGKGMGVGTYVVSLLKNKIIEQGKVPFYGTVESHIKSQRVAINAGFLPVFAELFSEKA